MGVFCPFEIDEVVFYSTITTRWHYRVQLKLVASPKRRNKTHPNTKHSLLGVADPLTSILPNHMLLHDMHPFTEHKQTGLIRDLCEQCAWESIYLQKLYYLMSNPYCSHSHAIEFPIRAISLKLYNLTYYNTTPFESSLRKNCQFQLTKQQNESVRSCYSALQPTTCAHTHTQHVYIIHMLAHVKTGTGVLYVTHVHA